MTNKKFSKVRLLVVLMLITLIGLGTFTTIVYTSARNHHETMLSESILAHLRVLTTILDENIKSSSLLPASSSKIDEYRYTNLQREVDRESWAGVSGVLLPEELQHILKETGQTQIALSGVVRGEKFNHSWALIPATSGRQGHFAFRSSTPYLPIFWSELGGHFAVAIFVVLWLVLWTALSIGGLVSRSRHQNQKLLESAKQLANAHREAVNATQAKSEFLSRMSHELRTPMNAVLGFAQLLQTDESLKGEQKEFVGHVLGAGEHLLSLINEMLDLERIEAGKIDLRMESVDLCAVTAECERLTQSLAEKNRILIKSHLVDSEPHVAWADRMRLKQVMLNLITNAIKYNCAGGEVQVSCETAPNDQVCIEVRDTGQGINDEDIDSLFQPFSRLGAEQTDIEGTGIGLTITKKLVELMHGQISVKSVLGTGSTFTIYLPASSQ